MGTKTAETLELAERWENREPPIPADAKNLAKQSLDERVINFILSILTCVSVCDRCECGKIKFAGCGKSYQVRLRFHRNGHYLEIPLAIDKSTNLFSLLDRNEILILLVNVAVVRRARQPPL